MSVYMSGELSTTAMGETSPSVADATRHGPDLCVYPVLTPSAPRYVFSSGLLFT